MLTIVTFGLKPNQVETGMGGTILKLTESGHKVIIIDLTDGSTTKKGQNENRKKEAIKASRILGIDERITLNFSSDEMNNNQETCQEIGEIFQNTSPDVIFLPYPTENYLEIQKAEQICRISLNQFYQTNNQNSSFNPYKRIFYYFADPLNYYQKPSFIMDISKEIEMKVEALKCYESQLEKSGQDSQLFENTLNLNRYHGMLIGKKFGESFISKEPLSIQNFEFLL